MYKEKLTHLLNALDKSSLYKYCRNLNANCDTLKMIPILSAIAEKFMGLTPTGNFETVHTIITEQLVENGEWVHYSDVLDDDKYPMCNCCGLHTVKKGIRQLCRSCDEIVEWGKP
jgi:hypothetical protein